MARSEGGALPVILSIAGSDSGGGAGIQADLNTFAALGCFGTTAITCITAQNPDAVEGIEQIAPQMAALQIKTVCAGFPVAAAKTGMLFSAEIIKAVSTAVTEAEVRPLVVDPVMVASSGARLLRDDAIEAMRSLLLPKAAVITPNLDEAEVLCGYPVRNVEGMKAAAVDIASRYGTACVVKGGHLAGGAAREKMVNALHAGGETTILDADRVENVSAHGTGCTFSAAIASYLGKGAPLVEAVRRAGFFVADAMKSRTRAGSHYPLGWHVAGINSRG